MRWLFKVFQRNPWLMLFMAVELACDVYVYYRWGTACAVGLGIYGFICAVRGKSLTKTEQEIENYERSW